MLLNYLDSCILSCSSLIFLRCFLHRLSNRNQVSSYSCQALFKLSFIQEGHWEISINASIKILPLSLHFVFIFETFIVSFNFFNSCCNFTHFLLCKGNLFGFFCNQCLLKIFSYSLLTSWTLIV